MQPHKPKLPKNHINTSQLTMTIKTPQLISFALIITLTTTIKAQQNVNKELVQLVNKSFTYNPRINELQQQVLIQQQKMEVAKTYLLPTVNATAGYNYITPVGKTTFPTGPGVEKVIQFQPNNNLAFGLGVNYQVLDFGRTQANIAKTKTEIQQSKDNVEFNKAQLAAQLATVYYSISYLKNAVIVQDSILLALNETRKQAENKLKNGDALELEVLTINSTVDAEKNKKIELETLIQKQLNVLLYSTGVDNVSEVSTTNFNFVASNNLITKDEVVKQAQENNLDIKLAKQKNLLTLSDWNINKRAYYPSINLIGNAGMRNGYQPSIDNLKFNYLLGVSFNAPLFQGGRFKQQKQLFEANEQLNNLTLTTLTKNYERDIVQAIADINSYTERLSNMQGQINQAKKAVELSNLRYKSGVALQLEYLNSLTTLQKIKLSALNYQYQLCVTQVELARLIGNMWW